MKKNQKKTTVVSGIVLGVCATIVLSVWHQQEKMIFPGAHLPMPAAPKGLDPFKIDLQAYDGTPLQAWVRSVSKEGAPVVVYFGGNYEQSGWFVKDVGEFLSKSGVSVATMNYRGFAGNPGVPSEKNLTNDGLSLLTYIREKHPNSALYLVGRSLGSGVASAVYAEDEKTRQDLGKDNAQNVRCINLITPFASMEDPAKNRLFFFPSFLISTLLRHKFDSIKNLSSVPPNVPIYIVQAGKDKVVPTWSTQRLIKAIPKEQVKTLNLPNATHSNVMTGEVFWGTFSDVIRNQCSGEKQSEHIKSTVDKKTIETLKRESYNQKVKGRGATKNMISAYAQPSNINTHNLDAHFLWHLNFLKQNTWIPEFVLPKN